MQRAALHAAAVAVSVENITVKSTPKKTVFVTAKRVKIEAVKSYRYRPAERNIHRLPKYW